MTRDMDEKPIYVNMPRLLELSQSVSDPRVLAVVVGLLAYGNNQAFAWDPDRIAAFMNNKRPDDVTADDLRSMYPSLLKFFVEVGKGRLAPSPDVFSAVDGNPDSMS